MLMKKMKNNMEKKGSVNLDINEYDRLMALERELETTKKYYSDLNQILTKSLVELAKQFIGDLKNQEIINSAMTKAGYSWVHTTSYGEEVKLGDGEKIIKLILK